MTATASHRGFISSVPTDKRMSRQMLKGLQMLTASSGELLKQAHDKNSTVTVSLTSITNGSVSTTSSGSKSKEGEDVTSELSRWFIAKSVKELATTPSKALQDKIVLIQHADPVVMLSSQRNSLLARQSKAHRFEIPDNPDMRILDITVSVIFQGTFNTAGEYKVGRLGAGLFRLPNPLDKKSALIPISLGFSPYAHQAPNTMSQLGKVAIFHKPNVRPLRPGPYQIVIGCGMYNMYSCLRTTFLSTNKSMINLMA